MGFIYIQQSSDVADKNRYELRSHSEGIANDSDVKINNLFKSIIPLLSSHFKSNLSIECIALEFLLSCDSTEVHLRKADSKDFGKDSFFGFALDFSIVDKLESKFLCIYELLSSSCEWNKARFFISRENYDYFFEYRFDPDLLWLQSIEYSSLEYQKLAPDIEDKILEWNGLPNDFCKHWIN